MTDVSDRLKAARLKAGYPTAKLFAQKNRIPYTTYSQYESSKRQMSPSVIVQICKMLNIDPSWLLTGENINQEAVNLSQSNVAAWNKAHKPKYISEKTAAAINSDLLAQILRYASNTLEELEVDSDFDELSILASEIYAGVIEITQDPEKQIQMIEKIGNPLKNYLKKQLKKRA